MKKIVLILLITPLLTSAQDKERYIRQGLVSGQGTLAIGVPTGFNGSMSYVGGTLQYQVEDNVSYRGEVWAYLGSTGGKHVFTKNSTLFTSYNYHITTSNNLDPYIGIGPGLSWTQLKQPEDFTNEPILSSQSSYSASVSPVASLTVGLNYYVKFAHLFVEAKYVQGVHLSDIPGVSLSELKIAFGFGFNINTIKKK